MARRAARIRRDSAGLLWGRVGCVPTTDVLVEGSSCDAEVGGQVGSFRTAESSGAQRFALYIDGVCWTHVGRGGAGGGRKERSHERPGDEGGARGAVELRAPD